MAPVFEFAEVVRVKRPARWAGRRGVVLRTLQERDTVVVALPSADLTPDEIISVPHSALEAMR